jgi:hypothetical protein
MTTLIKSFGDFELYHEEFTNINGVEVENINVKSKGKAEKHVIEIRLDGSLILDEPNGTKGKYKYSRVYVSHGMRGKSDTLTETKEYIDALTDALNVAFEIEKYCVFNNLWVK